MTAQSLANKPFYNFKAYYLNKLRYLRPMLIMNCIFAVLSYPTLLGVLNVYLNFQIKYDLIRTAVQYDANQYADIRSTLYALESFCLLAAIICILCLVGMFVFTLVTTLRSFRYLYSKNVVDMDYSLPVSHNTRFFGDFLGVITTSILPHLISVIIGLIILANFPTYDAEFQKDMTAISHLASQCMWAGFFSCVMLSAFTLLTLSVCGRKAEAYIYPILLNFAVPIIHGLGAYIVNNCFYGSSGSSTDYINEISATSPLGIIYTSFSYVFDGLYGFSSEEAMLNVPVFRPVYFIGAIAITLLFFIAAYFLMKYRLNHRVGMSYVYKGMNLVIPGIVILAISMPLFFNVWKGLQDSTEEYYSYTYNPVPWIIGALISTFIVYVIMELIGGRNFRKFHITTAKWAGTLAVCFGITSVLFLSDGFGKKYFVPDISDVAQVSFWASDSTHGDKYDYFFLDATDVTDPYMIQKITELHGSIDKSGAEISDDGSAAMYYRLKNGEFVNRCYQISDEKLDSFARELATPEWAYGCYNNRIGDTENKSYSIKRINFFDGSYTSDSFNVSGSRDIDIDKLKAAIENDCQKVNYDLLFGKEHEEQYIMLTLQVYTEEIYITDYFTIRIYGWMDNTIKVLTDMGIKLDT